MRLSGVYLVIDPSKNWQELLNKLELALEGGVQIVQVWNHWKENITAPDKAEFLSEVKALCTQYSVPILMHEDWRLCVQQALQGVHFDEIPENFSEIETSLQDKIIGITVGNDNERILWAERQSVSYISFCAVFPSTSVDTCEIVRPETIAEARRITQKPIFLSGGIQIRNLRQLKGLEFEGIAIVSGILSAENPKKATEDYIQELLKIKS